MSVVKSGALVLALAGVALAGVVSGAMAAPLAYDEAVSGDLPESPIVPLALDIGANTVKGSFVGGEDSDLDSFLFSLPSGMQVDSISFAFELSNNGAAFPDAVFELGTASQAVNFLDASPAAMFAGELPLTASQFLLNHIGGSCGCDPGEGFTVDYVLTLTVSNGDTDVPEPGSLALLAAGCGAFLLARRRQAASGAV